jgi:UDP-2,3-diacylglucosamine pyrophosphatase LpxH
MFRAVVALPSGNGVVSLKSAPPMLVLFSDLHLTDQSTAENVHGEAFTHVLLPEIAAAAQSKKAQDLDLVLLGDIVDLVRTDHWLKLDPSLRPWNGELDPQTATNVRAEVESEYQAALQKILATPSAQALKFACRALDGLKVEGRVVSPRIIYVIGNHDRPLLNYPSLQKQFADWLGSPVTFGHELLAGDYHLLARHGHIWDDHCYGYELLRKVLQKGTTVERSDVACHRVQTIGEVLTAELMSGLIYRVKSEVDSRHTPELWRLLMQVNNVRPEPEVLRWLQWAGRNRFNADDKRLVVSALRESVQSVLQSDLGRLWDKTRRDWFLSGDITDRLTLLRVALRLRFDELEKVLPLAARVYGPLGGLKDVCREGAHQELAARNVEYVVYGHTHYATANYDSAEPEGGVKMYLNTGTFLPVVQKARDRGFATDYRMTFTVFYRPEEDTRGKQGRTVSCEIWSGRKRKQYRTL